MDNDLGAILLKANSNKERICDEFTEVLRDLMRAVAAQQDFSGGLCRAVEKME